MPGSKLSDIFQNQRPALLLSWVSEQVAANTSRPDLLSEAELRVESERLLNALSPALRSGHFENIRQANFAPVLEVLDGLSRSRGQQGFTPSETAMFVFSLKQPLFELLKAAQGGDTVALLDDTWKSTLMLDQLGLYTTEVHQQAREQVIRRQQEDMLELSTPVVQLWDGVVALPLIGTLDSNRTSIVMETLLRTIVETRSEIAIIDITGVPTVDTLVAQHLLKTVAAARLMGAECIISGIRPQIAQTMVHLQIDLGSVLTRATMAEALRAALKKSGLAIGRAVARPNAG